MAGDSPFSRGGLPRLLIVDDSPTAVRLLQAIFKDDYDVVTARDGIDGNEDPEVQPQKIQGGVQDTYMRFDAGQHHLGTNELAKGIDDGRNGAAGERRLVGSLG